MIHLRANTNGKAAKRTMSAGMQTLRIEAIVEGAITNNNEYMTLSFTY